MDDVEVYTELVKAVSTVWQRLHPQDRADIVSKLFLRVKKKGLKFNDPNQVWRYVKNSKSINYVKVMNRTNTLNDALDYAVSEEKSLIHVYEERVKDLLDEREQIVFETVFIEEKTKKYAGQLLGGISITAVNKIIEKMRKKLAMALS